VCQKCKANVSYVSKCVAGAKGQQCTQSSINYCGNIWDGPVGPPPGGGCFVGGVERCGATTGQCGESPVITSYDDCAATP